MAVQNQTGRHPTKWDKTGTILENRPHSQVLIRMDGSRRVTLRNRRFVKQILPMTATTHTTAAPHTTAPTNCASVAMPQREMHIALPHEDEPIHAPGATDAVDPGHAADDLPDDAATELTGPQVTDVMDLRDAMKDEPEVPTVTLPPMTGTPI